MTGLLRFWRSLGVLAGVLVLLLGGVGAARGEDGGVATPSRLPAFEGGVAWLNVSEPIALAELRGRVVLVVFWAYSNAQVLRALPLITAWHTAYHDRGLEVIGVHSPEFSFERSVANVHAAVERLGIPYPVVVDSERRLWSAYGNHEWPAYYVADTEGRLLGFHIGVGREAQVEAYLRRLLEASGFPPLAPPVSIRDLIEWGQVRTPELSFRLPLRSRLLSPEPPVAGRPRAYSLPAELLLHGVALDGVWRFEDEQARVVGPTGRLVVRYAAPRCHLVLEGASAVEIEVRLDGRPVPTELAGADVTLQASRSVVRLDAPRLYRVVESPGDSGAHTLEVIVPTGVAAYACTFS